MTVSVLLDRVRETTTTTGTGTITLLGAATGCVAFSTLGNGVSCWYVIEVVGGSDWEVGQGTYHTGGTLSRDSVLASSNAGSLVSFTAGTKSVFLDLPAGAFTATPTANLVPRADTTGMLDKGWVPASNLGLHAVCQGRLTLLSGVAVTGGDVTAAGTIYFTPLGGGCIGLYDGTRWNLRTFSELSLSVPSLFPFQMADVYVYDNAGTPAIDYTTWSTVGVSITAFDGTSKFTTVSGHGLSVGDTIGIAGITGTVGTNSTSGANGRLWVVLTTPTSTTFNCENTNWSGLTYTSGGAIYRVSTQTQPTLTTQDQIQVKSADHTRRYVGTFAVTGGGQTNTPTTQQTEDSKLRRLVWNFYNQRPRKLLMQSAVGSWTDAVAAWRLANLNPINRVEVVIGQADSWASVRLLAATLGGANIAGAVGLGIDSTTIAGADAWSDAGGGVTNVTPSSATYDGPLAAGYRTINWLEYVRVGTVTWYGNGISDQQSAISGYVLG